MEAPLITPTYPKLADQKDGEEVRKSMLDLAQKMNEVVIFERRRVDNLVNSADDPYFIMYEDADTHVFALPENAPLKTTYSIMRTVASTNQISVLTSGGDTVEGGTSFVTHGSTVAPTPNTQIVRITKTSATGWSFTDGVISGDVSGRGSYKKYSDGSMEQWGTFVNSSAMSLADGVWSKQVLGTLPVAFIAVPYSVTGSACVNASSYSCAYSPVYVNTTTFGSYVTAPYNYSGLGMIISFNARGRWK